MKQTMIVSSWLLILCLLLVPEAKASHIVGGEMTYICLGGNRYQVSLTIFRDCENGQVPFDDPAFIGIFTNTGTYLNSISIPFFGNDDTLNLGLDDPCYSLPPDVCIHTYTYQGVVTLPVRAGGYHLAYQRCCRNIIIDNIINPTGTGATYDVVISEASLLSCNSSPKFREWPNFFLCLGSTIDYDYSAIDANGDSIVYELCVPYNGATNGNPAPTQPSAPPYQGINWQAGFGLNNMLGGNQPLQINAQTGRLTGTPTALGTYVVGVCAKEYRNGVLIGEIRRDFQYTIGSCGKVNTAQFFVPTLNCRNTLDVFHINNSILSTPVASYVWDFGDGSPTVTSRTPTHTYPDTGTYTVTLIAGAGQFCADTTTRQVRVQLNGVAVDITPVQTICRGDSVWFSATNLLANYNTITQYNWVVTDATILAGQGTDSILVLIDPNANFASVRLTATNDKNCNGQAISGIVVDRAVADFDIPNLDCNTTLATTFINQSSTQLNNFLWDFDGLATATDIEPTFNFPDTGQYQVTLIAGVGGCPDTLTKLINIDVIGVDLLQNLPLDACSGDTLRLTANNLSSGYSTIISYNWTASEPILSGQGTSQIVLPADTTFDYQVIVLNDNGCSDSLAGTIEVFIVNAFFDSLSNRACAYDLEVDFVNQSNSTGGTYQWNFGGLATSIDTNPTYVFPDTGSYEVQLIAGIGTSCVDTFSRIVPIRLDGVTISSSDAQVVCQGDTVLLVATNELPQNNTIVQYNWSPMANVIQGQGTDSILFLATNNVGVQVIGINNAGCSDTAFSTVNISARTPILSLSANPDSIFVGQSSQIDATNDINYTYIWQQDTTLSNTLIANPIAQPRQTTTYFLSIKNQFNCTNRDSITVYIKAPTCASPLVFVPNAFSPDNDGYNDVLRVEGNHINQLDFAIYNRWGELLFQTNDQSIGWDGIYEGEIVPSGVYGYYMQCQCDNGEKLRLKGNITVLR